MSENWKAVLGFEGRYEVSDLGRVRNASGRVLAENVQNSGYVIVHLYRGGRSTRTPALIHRLVAVAFVQGAGAEVNHLNGKKRDNRALNLAWVSRTENMQHAVREGLHAPRRFAVVGVRIADGEEVRFPSQIAAERALGGRQSSAIYHCLVGKKLSAYGYAWSRV